MKARNYEALVEKVGKALAMWEARKLSLLLLAFFLISHCMAFF
jgi:hypothetical protein